MEIILFTTLGLIISLGMIITPFIYTKQKNKEKQEQQQQINEIINNRQKKQKTYKIKKRYISNCEEEFFQAINQIINTNTYANYHVYPQVPLSQIVTKYPETIWHSELFRIIDFCIFSDDYKPLVCIEINDSTHRQYNRYKRDLKVKSILEEAELPLITLWTEYGVNKEYIAKRIREHIKI